MARFTAAEWTAIFQELDADEAAFGLPVRRDDSLILSSFNIRSLSNNAVRKPGGSRGRTQGAWDLLARYVDRTDLCAIQEVGDSLTGIRKIKSMLSDPDKWGMVVSDVTGYKPAKGARDKRERLAFLFRWERIARAELASDITYDRSVVYDTLFDNRQGISARLGDWVGQPGAERHLGFFLTFMRTPHAVAFRILGKNGASPIEFHAINAHLLFGSGSGAPTERRMEFEALLGWLLSRTRQRKRLYYRNMILFGDLNLEFDHANTVSNRAQIADQIKALNDEVDTGYVVNFPLLTVHPSRRAPPVGNGKGLFTSTARMTQTYDQIGIFDFESGLPGFEDNETAGQGGPDAYNYGVFRFSDLFAKALEGVTEFSALSDDARRELVERYEFDVSDHHPIWMRVPVPGA